MDIRQSLNGLYTQWFEHPDWWFHADTDTDRLIAEQFWGLMDASDASGASDVNHDLNIPNKTKCIARILLYDQVPRHALRGQVADHVIAYYLQKALEIAAACLEDVEWMNTVTDLELCFVLLPFRHTGIPHLCWKAAGIVWKRLLGKDGGSAHLLRFLKATYQRCPVHDQGDYLTRADGVSTDANGWDFTPFESVLEYAPVLQFGIPEKRTLPTHHPCWAALRHFVQAAHLQGSERVVVSVSGGVDSMVLLALLIEMRKALGLSFAIVAFHVNYANRGTESLLEEDFVRSWCCHRLKWFGGGGNGSGAAVYVRRISEIQRDPCMAHGLRSTYETYTRDVRYACYRFLCNAGADSGGGEAMVLLGHNQDDCFENILTNLCAQEKYEHLKGMQDISSVAGIQFGRPFLGVAKADIYGAARWLGIPYVQDSTPAWSQRGRIRDHVRPVLTEWNPRMVEGLFALSDTLQGFYALFEGQLQYCLEHTQWQGTPDGEEGKCVQEKRCTLLVPSHMHALLIQPLFWRAYLKALVGVVPSMKALHACLPKLEWTASAAAGTSSISLVLCKDVDIRVHMHGLEPSIRWTLDIRIQESKPTF